MLDSLLSTLYLWLIAPFDYAFMSRALLASLALSLAAQARMKASPSPVQDTAIWSSAQVPAPMIGVSPTRPGRLLKVPPVEVAAARSPC